MANARGVYLFVVLLLALAVSAAGLSININANPIMYHLGSYTIHTTAGALLCALVIVWILLQFITAPIRYLTKARPQRKPQYGPDILKNIKNLRRSGKKREAYQITQANFQYSEEILLQHLCILMRSGKKSAFLKLFTQYPCMKAVRVFNAVYCKKFSPEKRTKLVKKLCDQNNKNQVLLYCHISNLVKNAEFDKAKNLLEIALLRDDIQKSTKCTAKLQKIMGQLNG